MLQKHLNTMEVKYGDECLACGACDVRPTLIHDEPELAIPASPKEKDKDKAKDTADVMRTGPITLAADGSVTGAVAPSPVDAGGVAPAAGSGNASAASSSGGVAPAPANQAKQAYDIVTADCTPVPQPAIEIFGAMLFMKMAEEKLLEAYLESLGDGRVQTSYVPKSDPIIWLVRACKDFPADTLFLVPWASSLVQIAEEGTDDTGDAVLLTSIKRPKFHYGGLPLFATMRVQCAELDETLVFAA